MFHSLWETANRLRYLFKSCQNSIPFWVLVLSHRGIRWLLLSFISFIQLVRSELSESTWWGMVASLCCSIPKRTWFTASLIFLSSILKNWLSFLFQETLALQLHHSYGVYTKRGYIPNLISTQSYMSCMYMCDHWTRDIYENDLELHSKVFF